jgi:transcriptional regulator with XRE-family HTH domain
MICDKITSLVDIQFSDWLVEEMNKREWSQADLARYSGLNRQSISDYVNRRRLNPDHNALIAIANAFNISPITAFRKAGLLPPGPDDKVNFEDWQHLLEKMTDEERNEFWRFGQMKIEMRQEKEQAARASNFKVGKVKK